MNNLDKATRDRLPCTISRTFGPLIALICGATSL
jgi:hypothetical protein